MAGIQALTQHIQLATIQGFETVERANQGALAGSRWAHHHQHFTTVHLHAHPIESAKARGVALHQVGGADGNSHRLERTGSS